MALKTDDSSLEKNAMILQKMSWLCTDFGYVLLPGAAIVYFAD